MPIQTKTGPIRELQEKLPETYIAVEKTEVILEPGDLIIGHRATWEEVLGVLVKHANMDGGAWTTQSVVNALDEWT